MSDLKGKSMFLDVYKFDQMFPTYADYKVPMWSSWKTTEKGIAIKVAIPGCEKDEFELYVEKDSLFLKVTATEKPKLYSILERFWTSEYNIEDAKAEYKNGVLNIKVPVAISKSKKIIEVS